MARRVIPSAFVVISLLLAGSVALAQALPDPTRPPGNANDPTAADSPGGLQTIIRPTHGRPSALINGEVIQLGGKVGEARLVAINSDSVVLADSDGHRETLTLTPGIAKRPANKSKPSALR